MLSLARRGDISLYRMVNCAPPRRCIWPVLVPAQAWVRAGIGLRGAGGRTPPVSLRSTTSPERGGVAAGDGGVILLARRVLRSHFAYHTFLLKCLTFVPRLLFVARAKQGRLAGGCVPIPRGSRSPVERSQMLCGYRTCLVHFRLVRFFPAIPTGERSRRRGKVLFCENTLSLRCFPQGERWGLRAPKPAPKSHWLSGLSSLGARQSTSLQNLAVTAILELPHPRPAILGYAERPCRLQFMAGRVGLYIDVIYTHQPPDSSRPQAAKSRVACAKRCACRLSLPIG